MQKYKMANKGLPNYKILCLLIFSGAFWSCDKQKQEGLTDNVVEDTIKIAFYNVENLFDTEDDLTNAGDDEFTSDGKLNWTNEKYRKKLSMLTEVIAAMGYPEIVGLAEVENKDVLDDWVALSAMQNKDYQVAHLESNDYRGIDASLIFRASAFKVLRVEDHVISFPDDPDYRTRDIFMVKGTLENQDTIHLFVNHFPSRRGGQERSEPKRVLVASQLNSLIENTFEMDADAKVIVMGDFNDEPFNKSMAETLGATKEKSTQAEVLYNTMWQLTEQGIGSNKYRGNWQMLDQIILSGKLLDDQGYQYIPQSAQVFNKDWLLQQSGDYKGYPDRTYAGENYLGGYSDHLPVMIELYRPE